MWVRIPLCCDRARSEFDKKVSLIDMSMILLLVLYISFAIINYYLAKHKGKEVIYWTILGVYLSFFSTLILIFSKEEISYEEITGG